MGITMVYKPTNISGGPILYICVYFSIESYGLGDPALSADFQRMLIGGVL